MPITMGQPTARESTAKPAGWLRPGSAAVAAIAAVAVAWAPHLIKTESHSSGPAAEEPLAVEITSARRQAMPVLVEAVGQVISEHAVQVRPQVSGMLRQVYFTEGQRVSAGQRLFRIESAPFAAAATATKAAWDSAQGNAQRLIRLARQGYVTPQELINARAAADQARAAYAQAMINLEYTDVRAPIAGRTGVVGAKSGNIVSPSDSMPLVTINETQPVEVQFNVPQQVLAAVREHQDETVKVVVTPDNGSRTLDEGTLVFIDNAIDARTGTLLLRARSPNAREQLWPGQYVGVHMQLAVEPRAVVVPQTAVQAGQAGPYVYLVERGRVQSHRVKVDREVGDLAVIDSGLSGGEQVVRRVPRGLRPGAQVRPLAHDPTTKALVTLPSDL